MLIMAAITYYFQKNILISIFIPVIIFIGPLIIENIFSQKVNEKYLIKDFEEKKNLIQDRYNENENIFRVVREVKYFLEEENEIRNFIREIYAEYLDFNVEKYYKNKKYSGFDKKELNKYDDEFEEILNMHMVISNYIYGLEGMTIKQISDMIEIEKLISFEIYNDNYRFNKIIEMIYIYQKIYDEIELYYNIRKSENFIIYGAAGIGKTNFVFSLLDKYKDNDKVFNKYVIVCRNVASEKDLEIEVNDKKEKVEKIYKYLSNMEGSLIIYEGINESQWFIEKPNEFINTIKGYSDKFKVKTLITIRNEFLNDIDEKEIYKYEMQGFSKNNIEEYLEKNNINPDFHNQQYLYEEVLSNPLFLKVFVETYDKDNKYFISVVEYLKLKFEEAKKNIINKSVRDRFTFEVYNQILTQLCTGKQINEIEIKGVEAKEYLIEIFDYLKDEGIIEVLYDKKYCITYDILKDFIKIRNKLKNLNKSMFKKSEMEVLRLFSDIEVYKLQFEDEVSEEDIDVLYIDNKIYTTNKFDAQLIIKLLNKYYEKFSKIQHMEEVREYKEEYKRIISKIFTLQIKSKELKERIIENILTLSPVERDIKYIFYINESNIFEENDYIKYLYEKEDKFNEIEILMLTLCLASSNRQIRDNISVKIYNLMKEEIYFEMICDYVIKLNDPYVWLRLIDIIRNGLYENIFKDDSTLKIKEIIEYYLKNISDYSFHILRNIEIINTYYIELDFNIDELEKKEFKLEKEDNYFEKLKLKNNYVSFSICMDDRRSYGDWGRYEISYNFQNFIEEESKTMEKVEKYNEIGKGKIKKIKNYELKEIENNLSRLPEKKTLKENDNIGNLEDFLTLEDLRVYNEYKKIEKIDIDGKEKFIERISLNDLENSFAKLYLKNYGKYNQSILNLSKSLGRHDHLYERLSKKYQWILSEEILWKITQNYDLIIDLENDSWDGDIAGSIREKLSNIYDEYFSLMFTTQSFELKDLNYIKKFYQKSNLSEEDICNLLIDGVHVYMNLSFQKDYEENDEFSFYAVPFLSSSEEEIIKMIPEKAGDLYKVFKSYRVDYNFLEESNNCLLMQPFKYGEFSEYDYRKDKKIGEVFSSNMVDKFKLTYSNNKYFYDDILVFDYITSNQIKTYEEDDTLILRLRDTSLLKRILEEVGLKLYFVVVHWEDVWKYGGKKEYVNEINKLYICKYNFSNNKIEVVKNYTTDRNLGYYIDKN